ERRSFLIVYRAIRPSVGIPIRANVIIPMVEHGARTIRRLADVDGTLIVAPGVRASSPALGAERAQRHGGLPGGSRDGKAVPSRAPSSVRPSPPCSTELAGRRPDLVPSLFVCGLEPLLPPILAEDARRLHPTLEAAIQLLERLTFSSDHIHAVSFAPGHC